MVIQQPKANPLDLMSGKMVLVGGQRNSISGRNIKRNSKLFPTSTDPNKKTPTQPNETKFFLYKEHNQKLYLHPSFIEGRVDKKLAVAKSFQVRSWWNRHNENVIEFQVDPDQLDLDECGLAQKSLKTSVSLVARSIWQDMYIEAARKSNYEWLNKRNDGQALSSWNDLMDVLKENAHVNEKEGRMSEVCSFFLFIFHLQNVFS